MLHSTLLHVGTSRVSLPVTLHSCSWEAGSNSYVCSFVQNVFFFFLSALNVFSLLPFEYDMSRCISVFVFSFWYLFCLLFSELFYLWFDVFHDFWKFLVITSVNICRTSFLLSSPFEIHIIYMLDNFILFYSFWMLCTLSLLFFSLSWSCFYRFILKWIFLINWVNW